ncbi:hypothetical protein C2G38_2273497 [Gigaspora rosea]|uniref:Ricin B lectin domain-containing protein n=1 Tax=Gigaspora rosea TaxID=44941 RepID=A0A397UK03_9GLOM|nr:hypothetical protein C2G38_2273497 [Gigaspora rosea]
MDDLIPNNFVHVIGGKDLNITTGIPCKIINNGHYLDNGGGGYGRYVELFVNSYDRNDYNYARQIWFLEESKNYGEYRISSDRNYLDTFGGGHRYKARVDVGMHYDNPNYSRQLWTFSTQIISETEEVQIQNLSNKCYLDNWGGNLSCSNLWKTEITPSEKTPNITPWSFNKSKELIFLDKLDVDVKAEYAGVKGTFQEIINWNKKATSLETTKKLKLDETNISGKYSIEIQNQEEVEVKIIWHKVNLDIQFTAMAKIKGFSDRLRKNGTIAKMEQVDVNAVLVFLKNSGFKGKIAPRREKMFWSKLLVVLIYKVH